MPWIITPDATAIELEEFYPDAMTGTSLDLAWRKTEHAIAQGFVKSDAIHKLPKRLIMTGCVAKQATRKDGSDPFQGAKNRTLAACEQLEAMGDALDCVTIITQDKVYSDMVLIEAPIRWEVGGVMTFDLIFDELSTFSPTETFDAQIGAEIDIGEVSTATGTPSNLPTTPFADPEVFEVNSPFLASILESRCESCGTADNVFCLDACYNTVLSGG